MDMTKQRIEQEIQTRSGYTLAEFLKRVNQRNAAEDCLKVIRDLRQDFRSFTGSMAAEIGIKGWAFDRSAKI